jgi:hypothetical protein
MKEIRFQVLLLAITLAGTLHLGAELRRFGVESLQADFAAYYTAGESVRAGISPYDNDIGGRPPVWDGIAPYRHSRFLYPPLVAWLFVPLSLLAYAPAKVSWMLFSLGCVAAALVLAAKRLGVTAPLPRLALACCAVFFFPLEVLLERGQIDGVTLLLLSGGAYALSSPRRREWAAGMFFACGAFIKPHLAILGVLLLVRGERRALAGFAGAGLLLLVLSIAVHGTDPLVRYVVEEVPRISAAGEEGGEKIPAAVLAEAQEGVPGGYARKEGRLYLRSAVDFPPNATLVRLAAWIPRRAGIPISLGMISLLLSGAGLFLYGSRFARRSEDPPGEYVFWLGAFVVIMVCGPLTWAMNLVWLLPVFGVLLRGIVVWRGNLSRSALFLLAAGMLLAAVPEIVWRFLPEWWLRVHYPVAQLLVTAGLVPPRGGLSG